MKKIIFTLFLVGMMVQNGFATLYYASDLIRTGTATTASAWTVSRTAPTVYAGEWLEGETWIWWDGSPGAWHGCQWHYTSDNWATQNWPNFHWVQNDGTSASKWSTEGASIGPWVAGTVVKYQIHGYSQSTGEFWTPVTEFTVQALGNPTNVRANRTSGTSATITWTNSTDGAQNHDVIIVRKTTTGSFTEPTQGTYYDPASNSLGVVYNGSGTSWTDNGILSTNNYQYKVYTKNNNYYSSGVLVAPTIITSNVSASSATQCLGGAFSALSVTASGTGTLSYQWYSNASPQTTGGTTVGTNSNTYTPVATTAGTLYYYCVVTGDVASITSTLSGAFITNSNVNNPGAISVPASICVGTATNISNVTAATTGTPSSNGPTYYYYWQRTSSPVVGWTIIASSSASSYALPSEVINTPGTYLVARNSEFGCAGQTNNATTVNIPITVDAVATLGTLSNAGPINFWSATGDWSAVPISVSGQTGTVVWQYGMSNGGWSSDWVTANSPGYCCFPKKTAASDGNADRIRYYVKNGSCSNTAYSAAILLQNKYNEAPSSLGTSASTVCHGASVTLTANFPTTINILGTVEFATTCGGTPFASVTAGNNVSSVSTSVTPPVGTTTYYARYNPGTGNGCAPTACVSVAVTATASLSAVAVTSATAQTICATASGNLLTASETGGGTITSRAWGKRSVSGGAITALGVTTQTYTPTGAGLGAGTWYIVCTSTPSCGSAMVSNEVTVTVRPAFTTGTIASTGQTICYNTSPSTAIGSTTDASGGDATITYSWRSSADSYAAAISGATASTYTPAGPLTATTSYRRYAKDNTCNTTPTVSTGTWTVTVLPAFTTGIIASTGQTICYNTSPSTAIGSTTDASGGDATITYSWRSSADSYAAAISGATASTYTPAGPLTATTSYRRYAKDNTCNTTPTVSTGTWTVTVTANLSAVAVTSATAQTICATGTGTLLTASETGGGTITSRAWGKRSVSGGAITAISGQTGSTYTPTGAGLGAGTWYVVCTSTPTCGSAVVSNEVTVTVNTTTAITSQSTGTQTASNTNGVFTAISVTATGTSLSYQWYSNTTASTTGGTSLDAANGAQTNSYTPQYNSVGTLYYYCVVTGSCGTATSAISGAFVTVGSLDVASSNTDISTLPNCPTCDISVANDASLTINTARTYNSITISPRASLELTSGNTLTAASVILQSDASGTATLVDNTTNAPQAVTATVQQYLGSSRNWYITPPISGATVPSGQTYYSYDESGSNTGFVAPASLYWVAVAQGNALNPMKGYIAQPGASTTLNFSGTLNTGQKTVALTRTVGKLKEGFNLVANPYPSYLDWSLVDTTAAKIMTSVWYRTKTTGETYTFDTYNGKLNVATANGANLLTKLIPPMQAFWVRVKSGETTGTLTFTNAMRKKVDNPLNKFKAPKQENLDTKILRLKVSNGINSDEALLCFNSNASDAFDGYDSQKWSNANALVPEIFTQIGTEQLVINGMNAVKYNTEIPLGFSTGQANNFSISINEMTNFETGTRVILMDKVNPTVENELTNSRAYNFSASLTVATTDRFSLLFRAPTSPNSLNNTIKLDAQVFLNAANQIVIDSPRKCKYAIYNALGQLLTNGFITSQPFIANCELRTGIYIVKLLANENELTTRLVVK